jgi:hypothetical protein
VHPSQPDPGGPVVRLEFERPLEECRGVLGIARHAPEMPEVVRPSRLGGRQRVCIHQRGLGRLEEPRRQKELSQLAVKRRLRLGSSSRVISDPGEFRMPLAKLRADRFTGAREVR